jgi:chemotaxis signal transduction protein
MQIMDAPPVVTRNGTHYSTVEEKPKAVSEEKPTPPKARLGVANSIDKMEMLLLQANDSLFAVRAGQILRLLGLRREFLLPEMDSHPAMLGRLKGSELPVFDLCHLLGLESQPGSNEQLLVVENQGYVIGLLASAVREISRAPIESLAPLPTFVEQNREKEVAWALWKSPEGWVVVIDPANLLTPDEWQNLAIEL